LKPIIDPKEIFKVEIWLTELRSWLECEAIVQPKDVSAVYLERAKEIRDFLDKR
jgi:hypothetical protein